MQEKSPLEPAGPSPLLEADPSSINEFISDRIGEIFNKPSKSLTEDDLKIMVGYYRRERVKFLLDADAKALKEPKARKSSKPPTSVAQITTTWDDLI